jgi:acetylcholinesterase
MGVFNILAVLSGLAVALASDVCSPSLKVKTHNGVLQGFKDDFSNVAQFLGIPYGEHRRWEAAIPSGHFGTLKATSFGPNCAQSEPGVGGPWAPEFLIKPNSTSENCLFLNIWTPEQALCPKAKPLPVIVWIHGGGFTSVCVAFYVRWRDLISVGRW